MPALPLAAAPLALRASLMQSEPALVGRPDAHARRIFEDARPGNRVGEFSNCRELASTTTMRHAVHIAPRDFCILHGACDACTSASTPRPCQSPPEAVRTWHRATAQREMRYRTHALRHAIPAPPAAAAAPSRKPSKVVGPGMRRDWHPASLNKTHECDNIGERHDTRSMNARESLEAGVGRTITETG